MRADGSPACGAAYGSPDFAMSTRNAVEIYDAQYARKQQMLAEPHKYASQGHTPRAPQPIPLSADTQKKIMDALAKESEKLRVREEERRKRDPTYRPDAIELSNANLLEFDKYVDYYAVLEIDQFASAGEIKAAYKKLSLELHPDKQKGKSEAEQKRAKERFLSMNVAHNILSDIATRRAYDNQRDTMDARNDAGLLDAGKCEKPPPTCVDVEVTLEQIYRGTRKQVRFTRNEFANTRWFKQTHDDYNVKVNRGEYEGATIWHRNQGDVGPFGRADLVFVVKQMPHAVFERLGDDLWYYDRYAVPASNLFYCGWAPTLGPTPKSTIKHKLHTDMRQVACFGTTLAALLGYDRSGLGEALVPGHGMPLRDDPTEDQPDRTKGDLVVKFNIEVPKGPPKRLKLSDGDGTLPLPPIGLITPDDVSGKLPIDAACVLLTSTVLPAVMHKVYRARLDLHRRQLQSKIPPSYPPPLPGDLPLPTEVSPSALPPYPAEKPLPSELTAVCLLVGGGDDSLALSNGAKRAASASTVEPSLASRQLMGLISSSLPNIRWTVIHMSAFVSEPLLGDEIAAIEHSAILLLEANTDEPEVAATTMPQAESSPISTMATPPEMQASSSPAVGVEYAASGSLAPEEEAAASSAAASTSEAERWYHVSEWVVSYSPGVRVRSEPRPDAPCTTTHVVFTHQRTPLKPLRSGQAVDGILVRGLLNSLVGHWIQIGGKGSSQYVQCATADGKVLVRPAKEPEVNEGKSTASAAEDAAYNEALAAVTQRQKKDAFARPADWADESAEVKVNLSKRDRYEQEIADAEQAEDDAWEADTAGKRDGVIDEAYLEGGCGWASALMSHPCASCLHTCHINGGVVLAVGDGCGLLSHAARRRYAHTWTSSYASEGLDHGTVRIGYNELVSIREEALADDLEINYAKMCHWTIEQARYYFENNGVMPAKWAEGAKADGSKSEDGGATVAAADATGASGLRLPYLISSKPSKSCKSDADGWRGLRASTLRSGLTDDSKHGYLGIGLPGSCVLSILTNQKFVVRSVLGSSSPNKVSLRKCIEEHGRREERFKKKKLDKVRFAVLKEMEEECLRDGGDPSVWRVKIEDAAREGGSRTTFGDFRGACTLVPTCTGFTRPQHLPRGSKHANSCACCGCSHLAHEKTVPLKQRSLAQYT